MAAIMQDLARPFPAPKPGRPPFKEPVRALSLDSDDPSTYEAKWLTRPNTRVAVRSNLSPPARTARSLDIDRFSYDIADIDGSSDVAEFSKSHESRFLKSPMSRRPKFASVPEEDGTVPSPLPLSTSGGRRDHVGSMSLP